MSAKGKGAGTKLDKRHGTHSKKHLISSPLKNNIDKIEVNGQVLNSENLIANIFNKNFSSVGLKTVYYIPPSPRTPESYLPPPLPDSIFINPVTSFEIIDILSDLKEKKPGY